MVQFSDLVGKTLKNVYQSHDNKYGDDEIVFVTDDDKTYRLYHSQDCCESVNIEDIVGDLKDLVDTPILDAEEASNSEDDPGDRYAESYTWTYYKLRTIKGSVDIRWFGSSNGYYSERVSFGEV